jgi:hypothetical protein
VAQKTPIGNEPTRLEANIRQLQKTAMVEEVLAGQHISGKGGQGRA